MVAHAVARLAYGVLRDRAPRVRGRKRLGHALAWALARRGPVKVTSYGLLFELDLRDRVEEGIFWEDYDRETLSDWANWMTPDATVLDVGANVGIYSLVAAKAGAKVHAFEPNPRTRERLLANVRRNGFEERVIVHGEALSDQIGEAHLFDDVNRGQSVGNSGVASLSNKNAGGTSVPVRLNTLDAFAEETGVERLDWIKMDVQGAELPALRGGADTLRRLRPSLILEMDALSAKNMGWTEVELRTFLGTLDYRVEALDSLNLIARPK